MVVLATDKRRRHRAPRIVGELVFYAEAVERAAAIDNRELVVAGERFSYEPEPARVMLGRDAAGVLPPSH